MFEGSEYARSPFYREICKTLWLPVLHHTWHLLILLIVADICFNQTSLNLYSSHFFIFQPFFLSQSYYKAILLKSHFGMSVVLYICGIFSEHLFLRSLLERCFWTFENSFYLKQFRIWIQTNHPTLQKNSNATQTPLLIGYFYALFFLLTSEKIKFLSSSLT